MVTSDKRLEGTLTMDHQEIIDRFYKAFSKADAETMAATYADTAEFSDPVFPRLNASEVRGMWRMLCSRASDLELSYVTRKLDAGHYQVDWDARYTFSKTGRKVHNKITADLFLKDGLIVKHRDNFSFWRWSRQALGLPGLLLGWTPLIQGAVRKEAAKGLAKFLSR